MAGGALSVLGGVIHPLGDTSQFIEQGLWIPSHFLGFMGSMLILLGLVGWYSGYSSKLGSLGLIGFLLFFFGLTTFGTNLLWGEVIFRPLIVAIEPSIFASLDAFPVAPLLAGIAGFVPYALGYPIFALTNVRAKVLPRWVIWPVVVFIVGVFVTLSGLVLPLGNPVGITLIGLSFAGSGYALYRAPRETGAPRNQVTA